MKQLIKLLESSKSLDLPVHKHTLLIDEKKVLHGALFYVQHAGKTYKIMVPNPHHEALLKDGDPSAKQLLEHSEAMLLK